MSVTVETALGTVLVEVSPHSLVTFSILRKESSTTLYLTKDERELTRLLHGSKLPTTLQSIWTSALPQGWFMGLLELRAWPSLSTFAGSKNDDQSKS